MRKSIIGKAVPNMGFLHGVHARREKSFHFPGTWKMGLCGIYFLFHAIDSPNLCYFPIISCVCS